ncbi:MAG TPA: DUF4279 domain-containing protein [Candidatus Acidoferrales bacterium]|nr:DUF4279 domain-containing protein [Candidatus Acidoferrales bacterium]
MTEPNEQYAYFTVTGDFDPADISQLVGVPPTECWLKGDVNPRTQIERKFSRWSLYSRLERTRELEAHIADVIEQLGMNRREFVELSSKHRGIMQLVAYFRTDYPGLHFDKDLVESLAEHALSVDFDFYYLYSDVREDS